MRTARGLCDRPDNPYPKAGRNRIVAEDELTAALSQALAICQDRGGRLTPQRRAVLGALLTADRPLTAYDLLDVLRPTDPALTPASTYRSLDFLVGMGLAHRLETTHSFLACRHPDHPHASQFLICRRCGSVVEAEDQTLAEATAGLGERHGFKVDRRTVELTGLCAPCDGDAQPG